MAHTLNNRISHHLSNLRRIFLKKKIEKSSESCSSCFVWLLLCLVPGCLDESKEPIKGIKIAKQDYCISNYQFDVSILKS